MNTSYDSTQKVAKPGSIRRWLSYSPLLLVVAFISLRYFQMHRFPAPKQILPSKLVLENLDGSSMDPARITGKAIVLNFWAPWCPPCRLETPWLQHLQDLHPNDLMVVGVVADPEQYKQSLAFMNSRGIRYPLVRDTMSLDRIVGGVAGLPTTFYISRSGDVMHSTSGLIPELLMKRYAEDAVEK